MLSFLFKNQLAPFFAPSFLGLFISLFLSMSLCLGCASLYQHQMNSINTETTIKGNRFEIILSEKNVNMTESELGSTLSKKMVKDKLKREKASLLRFIASHFTLSPVDINPIFIEDYADKLAEMILLKCPNGSITGLTTTKERTSYEGESIPIRGAIVKVTGYCWKG